ncbi:class I SAM-dependent methyltransferase [Paenibacillus beijingensis]|uniref:SAM-dependent methyltransferase n=1 Tax=Paenibacillus beijingensis TaxID=1126833 RepID=A0A0D5NEP4_9BACL|nr:class I SAM-dependent methyltransferase [Paenibacillus beijingensis]AJY73701.1 SAM-dependent methyltransferase [Paenibacillus beijingensis]
MGFLSVLSTAHRWIAERVQPGSAVIDATVGGGVDARFLAETVGPKGVLYGFDIQAEALLRTEARLAPLREQNLLPEVHLLQSSHSEMERSIPRELHGTIAAIMFNLGYLPGADTTLVTLPETTLAALDASMRLLAPGGILTCVLYPGHPGGREEADAVEGWAAALPSALGQAALYRMIQKPAAPYLVAIEKRTSISL